MLAVKNHKKVKKGRTKAQIDLDRVEMIPMIRRGMTYDMIAEVISSKYPFTLSAKQIAYDWMMVMREQVSVRKQSSSAELVEAKRQELAEMKKEAWSAYEMSKRNAIMRNGLMDGDEEDAPTKITLPSNEFMNTLLKIVDRELILDGLDAPSKKSVEVVNEDRKHEATQFLDAMLPLIKKAQELSGVQRVAICDTEPIVVMPHKDMPDAIPKLQSFDLDEFLTSRSNSVNNNGDNDKDSE
jgi:hypothetical protein